MLSRHTVRRRGKAVSDRLARVLRLPLAASRRVATVRRDLGFDCTHVASAGQGHKGSCHAREDASAVQLLTFLHVGHGAECVRRGGFQPSMR